MSYKTLQKNIPKGWQVKQIKDICENFDSKRVPISKEKRESGPIPYYGATGVVDHVSGYIFNEDLLLVGEDGADWSKFAKTAYSISGKSWVNNHAHVLKCTDVHQTFLENYLNFHDLNSYISGGTRGKLTKGILENIPVLLPVNSEQKKIAEILSSVDEEVQKVEEIISKTEELKRGLMKKSFTKGKEYKLNDLCVKITGGGTPARNTKEYWGGDIPWVTVKDLTNKKFINDAQEKITNTGLENSASNIIPKGNIITSTRMGIGRFYINDANVAINQDLKGLILKDDIVVDFLYYFLLSRASVLESKGVGSTVKGIKVEELKNLPVFVPNVEDQKKIAGVFSLVDEKISINQSLKEKLVQLKKGLMADLLSGKVRTI